MEKQPTAMNDAEKLMVIVESLRQVMEEEIGLVEKFKYNNEAEILRRKQELSLTYQATLKSLHDNPQKEALMQNGMRDLLTAAGKKLAETASRNARALQIAQASTGRLLQVMMDEIRRNLHADGGYSKQAVLTAAQKSTSIPVAVSQRV
jgi:flagellar biosynthesis/type III secretory pathway chaperone